MAELPPIKKPPKQSSTGLNYFFAPTKFKHNYTLYKRAMEPIDNTDNILHSYSPNDEYDFIEIF